MSSAPAFRLRVDDTLGAASVGFSVSCVVFGILSTQVWTYFRRYPSDRPAYKCLVLLLWGLELLDQIFIGYSVYYYTITNFTTPLVLITGDVIWTLIIQIMLGALVGTIVKACFAMRVWRFSDHNIWVTGLILLLTIGQFGLAIAYTVKAFEFNKLIYVDRLKTIATLALGSGVITDTLTAASLSFFLRKLRSGHKKSDSLVNSLTIYAVNTGAITSAISLTTLCLYNTHPKQFYFMATYFLLGKLYAISFMATLNTRKIIRGRGTDRAGGTSNTANAQGNTFLMVSHHGRTQNNFNSVAQTKSVEIGIHQEIVSDVERLPYQNTHPYAIHGYR